MKSDELKRSVQAAIAGNWETFAQDHPRLAAVMDESLLVDAAMASLADDPEYQETIAQADAMGTAAAAVHDFVAGFVRRWLRELL